MLVGRDNDLMKLKDLVMGTNSRMLRIVSVVGMLGIGKTALVREVYDCPSIVKLFTYKAWVRIGPSHSPRAIILRLMRSLDLHFNHKFNNFQLRRYLEEFLHGKKYLIVLDDVYCDHKELFELRNLFPASRNGSRVIMTSRRMHLPEHAYHLEVHEVSLLDENESWDLLCYAAIGEKSCPYELVKIGKVVAKKCQGLPLKLVVLGSLLSRKSLDPETWCTVAEDHKIQNREMLKVLQSLDHEELPKDIKLCFLYTVAFPPYQHISIARLFPLWIAEGVIESKWFTFPEWVAVQCLEKMATRSLVLVRRSKSTGQIKTCSIHSAIWPYYDFVAAKYKIFKAIESYKDRAGPGDRRFSIHKSILFVIKDVYDSISTVSTTRSLLFTGTYHPYPLQVNFISFRLLRVLEATAMCFYKFPVETLKLVLLRFLGLTLKRVELPASISKLAELQSLIVHRHYFRIKKCGAPCFLPMEIWNMKKLRHLQVMGNDLPTPLDATAQLPYLITLLGVGHLSYTKEILSRIPKLNNLGIQAELGWDDATTSPFQIFDHLVRVKTFKYMVINPAVRTQVDYRSRLWECPTEVTLSGCGLSWESIKVLAASPHLKVLKLRCHAFEGSEWKVNDREFASLRYLLLEDLDIQHWRVKGSNFKNLEHLIIRHCYRLHEIPSILGNISALQTIDLDDCSHSALNSAMQMQKEQDKPRFRIHSSLNDHNSHNN